jgi:hypothetical protein
MSDADTAYARAQRKIAWSAETGAERLDFNFHAFRALTKIPPEIAQLPALWELDLRYTQITDLAPLAGLVDISNLLLDGTQITDLAPLAGMVGMRSLSLTNTQVTDLTPLAGMVEMQRLWLDDTQITDLAPLAGMVQLQDLVLRGSQVVDLRPIARLQRLGTSGALGLDFANTPATAQDARLAELAQITDAKRRSQETLAYLRSLPPWVDPAQKLSEALPLAEDLVQNPATGAFDVRPRPVVKPDLYAVNLEQVADALADVLASPNNGLNATSPVVIRLKRTLDHYANDPQRIETDFTTAHASLTRQMAQGDLPVSDENQHLQMVVLQGAQGIRATHADIAANRRIMQEQALREMTAADIAKIAEAAPMILEALTEGNLQQQMADDIPELTSGQLPKQSSLGGVRPADSFTPWQTRTPTNEFQRFFGRIARITILLRKMQGASKRIKAHPLYEWAEILLTLSGLVALGLALL